MKNKTIIIAIIFIISILQACGSNNTNKLNDKEEANITFAEPARILSFAPLYVAIEKGYFEDEDINADISSGGGGSQVTATLLSGDSDFAISAPRAMFSAQDSGEDFIAIQALNSALTYEIALSSDNMEKVDIHQDSSLNEKLEALEGSTLGIDQVGDSSDVYLRYLMEEEGLDQTELETVKLTGSGSKIGSMQEEAISGGIQSPPFSAQAEDEEVGELVLQLSEEEMYEELAWEVLFAKKDFIENNPEVSTKVVKALGKGIEYVRDNPEESAKEIDSYFDGIDEELIAQSLDGLKETYEDYGRMSERSWENAQTPLVEMSDMSGVSEKQDTTEGELWTNEYIEKALSEE